MTAHVLIIDDDPDVPLILGKTVGMPVRHLSAWTSESDLDDMSPAACFIDVHLADSQNGIELIPTIKQKWPGAALFVITADDRADLIGEALAAGAHDFLQKPLRPAEVRARLKARLEEARIRDLRETQRYGDLGFNYRLRRVSCSGRTCHLSPLAAELLQVLIEAKSEWVKKAALKRRLWGGQAVSDNALDQRIREVRVALASLASDAAVLGKYGHGVCLKRTEPRTGQAEAAPQPAK